MKLHLLTLSTSLILLLYHQVTTLIPLFPWNDVEKYSRNELWLEAGLNGLFMGTGTLCLFLGNTGFLHYYPLVYYPFLFVGECLQWWVPYLSPEFAKSKMNFDYDAHFARTFKFLAHKPGQRTPDANHTVLHLLTFLTILLVYLER